MLPVGRRLTYVLVSAKLRFAKGNQTLCKEFHQTYHKLKLTSERSDSFERHILLLEMKTNFILPPPLLITDLCVFKCALFSFRLALTAAQNCSTDTKAGFFLFWEKSRASGM